ncbi:MAG: YeeE/YedE thiosulfate transporter family protein [Rhodospirillaceae bacterium]
MDWLAPLSGGALIGLAAVLLMALNGRVAGISGIVAGLLPPEPLRDAGWRLAFLLGLPAGAVLTGVMLGRAVIPPPLLSPGGMAVAGLLVGLGTALGSGCTSGHGVCGLARLSHRSFAATLTFMAAAIVTVFLTRHLF